jgi:hypothetical protein
VIALGLIGLKKMPCKSNFVGTIERLFIQNLTKLAERLNDYRTQG